MSRGVTVTAKHDKRIKAWSINFAYGKYDWNQVKTIIDVIKFKVPASDRGYDPTTKTWTVLEGHYDFIKQLVTGHNFALKEEKEVDYEDFFYNTIPEKAPITRESLAAKLITILGITEEELKDELALKKIYRRKALELHPDRNAGDGSRMSELNSVWSAYNA